MELRVHQDDADRRADRGDPTYREVDIAEQEEPNLSHSQQNERCRLDKKIREVPAERNALLRNWKYPPRMTMPMMIGTMPVSPWR